MIIKSALDSYSRSGVCWAVLFMASDLPRLLDGPIHFVQPEEGDVVRFLSFTIQIAMLKEHGATSCNVYVVRVRVREERRLKTCTCT